MMSIDTHVDNPLVHENSFIHRPMDQSTPPQFATSKDKLPHPIWEGHEPAIDCYWKAWELAFGNIRKPNEGSGFVSPFIDTAFNNCLFMWDSAFALMFGRYGVRAFNFQKTLDNFYAHQHKDGYICREIQELNGEERFERFDPSSTGPNILPWCEWEYFMNTGDLQRLADVFPVLLAYSHWFRKHRSWPDGTYWSSGWGCGMDNQPRLPAGYSPEFDHGHMSWVDTTCQQVLANRILIDMAKVLDREQEVSDLVTETKHLETHLNEKMWNEQQQFYTDRDRDGSLSDLKSIGSFWALLADILPEERQECFMAHLENETEFNRPHRVPTLSADHPLYDPEGGYWLGGVWAPTTYMVLRGLSKAGKHKLAHEIGVNHVENVVTAFVNQGTLFENYAPEKAEGKFKRDFVGWTGLPPIAVLFEYVFGLRPEVSQNTLRWDVRLLEKHGVNLYPFGVDTLVDLLCEQRTSTSEAPTLRIVSTTDIEMVVSWGAEEKNISLRANIPFKGVI
ncbi:trehalase family glycosidase [Kiritimatiellota bacterium B12222]|nr:trehalase family glycosidase [Kiritimatiellota bacterium B12222]